MILTRKQEEAVRIVVERYKSKQRYAIISGYAGTGKSTCVKFIIEALSAQANITPETDVCYCTFTGKAAEVLRKKGNHNAITIHRLLYDSVPTKDGKFIRKKKEKIDYKIVVIDEISMVSEALMADIAAHTDVFVIGLGDPFQLPPLMGKNHGLLEHPHVFLDEIMRQAADSEIIQLSMKIRNREYIPEFLGKEVSVAPQKVLGDDKAILWADQILCGTNKTRQALNTRKRKLLGYEGMPQSGERMICLQNYWDDLSYTGEPLVNGTTGIIYNPFESFRVVPRYLKINRNRIDNITANFVSDTGDDYGNVEMDKKLILTGEETLTDLEKYKLGKLKKRYGDLTPRLFDYGYCITGHKSQGSEWENVLVVEEDFPSNRLEHARWLYTCVTRSSEKLVLITKD